MDQKKIGSFLKNLRKEKELTQEQLAEHFNVSNRTISRWETGNNMPDLSLLIELADFYDVEIREIINGERKSEKMNQEEKETMTLVADYAENERNILLKRLRNFSIVGLVAMIVLVVLTRSNIHLPVVDYIRGVSFGLAFSALLVAIFYSTGVLANIKKDQARRRRMKIIAIVAIVIGVLLLGASIYVSLASF
ncbi:MAG: helix-turn-helix domain-containing protein [Lachnospiraceae bacterium]|nr:helix-turn-helix domain-containing protein [Lachnospiraceae bacterium]